MARLRSAPPDDTAPGASLLMAGALGRVGGALAVIALLWLAVAWALA
jgi:hypothetical protein